MPIGDLLEALLDETGYVDALKAERTIEAQGREENLAELVEVAREFDATAEAEQDTLDVFLQQVALVADADTRTDDEGLVTLMTLHNAKGLEYPIVFIAGHGGGRLPALARARRGRPGGGAPARLRRHHAGDAPASTSSSARRRNVFGATQYGMRSRFLDEIPAELTDRPSERAAPAGLGRRSGPAPDVVGVVGSAARGGAVRRLPPRRRRHARGLRRRRRDRASSPAGSSSCASPATAASASSWPSTRPSRSSDRAERMAARGHRRQADRRARADRRRARGRAVRARSSAASGRASRRSSSATTLARRSTSPASRRPAGEVGMEPTNYPLPADTPREELVELIERLNADRQRRRHPPAAAGPRAPRRRRADRA